MGFKRVSVFLLTTELCMIGIVLGARLDSRFVHDYDIDGYILSLAPRFKRELNDLKYSGDVDPVGIIPGYLSVWDKLMPDMKNKMEIIKGNLFLPRPSENHSSDTVPPSFIKSEPFDSSPGGYVNENEKETYQKLNIRPEAILTEGTGSLETKIPDSYLVQGTGNQMNWREGGGGDENQVALNANSDMYKLTGNMNPNFDEEVFNINHLETESDPVKDGVRGCYSQCLQNCYGTSSVPATPHCESTRHTKPLIININSECLTHPGHRFSHGYGFKPKLRTHAMKFHGPTRGVYKYSSCPFSDVSPFYY